MQNHGEPSVEEILDSIKKVIARDSEARAEVPQRRRGLVAGGGNPADSDETEDILELGAGLGEELIIEDDAGLDAVYGMEAGENEEEGLIADATRSAMQQNFAALTMLAKPGRQPQIVRQGETSLESTLR